MRKQSKLAKGRFTGDPSYEYEHVEVKKTYGEGDEVTEEEETVSRVGTVFLVHISLNMMKQLGIKRHLNKSYVYRAAHGLGCIFIVLISEVNDAK